MFKSRSRDRCEIIAEYVIETGATVRATANHFGIISHLSRDLLLNIFYPPKPI